MRSCIFIDGSNLYATLRSLSIELDYDQLLKHFKQDRTILRAYYYTAMDDGVQYSPIKPLVDWLSYNGYIVVSKSLKEFIDPNTGIRRTKGNMDIEIAVDMLNMAPYYDEAILFSGDGDFRYLIENLQRVGKTVTVVSSKHMDPPMIADEIRRQADQFIDIYDIKEHLGRVDREEYGD